MLIVMRRPAATLTWMLLLFSAIHPLLASAEDTDNFEKAFKASSEAAGRRDWRAAAPLAKRAYDLGREQFGSPHATTATLALNLGIALANTGRAEEARTSLDEAIAATQGLELEEPVDALAWLEIARLERNARHPERYANKAIKILATRYEKEHPLYIRAQITRAQLLRARGGPAMESAMKHAVTDAEKLFGATHPVTGDAHFAYAKLQLELKNYDRARRSYKRALAVPEAQDPKNELVILALHEHLAVTYEKLGKDDLVDYHMEACAIEQIGDSEPIAVIRYAPRYPARALRRNKGGWVDLEFTIAPNGRVEEPRVIASSPKGMFDKSALDAVKTWRYKPRIEGGRVVPREGARVRFDFKLR